MYKAILNSVYLLYVIYDSPTRFPPVRLSQMGIACPFFETTSVVTRSTSTENISRKGTTNSIKGIRYANLDDH